MRRIGMAFAIMLGLSACAAAQAPSFHDLLKNSAWQTRFATLFTQISPPKWLETATETPARAVTLNGKRYQVRLVCKQHDCGNHQLALLYNRDTMLGLLVSSKDNSPTQTLTWLNFDKKLADDALAIDGKTLLYAAISGSLFNHPNFSLDD